MELKKVSSAGDPDVVRNNRMKIDPLLPSIIAILVQLLATVYLYHSGAPKKAALSSAVLTAVYIFVSYLLNKKPSKKKPL